MSKGGIKAIFAYYQTLGQNFVDALEDMLVFDAIICNTDRHYGNFGVLVDNKTNTIAAPAPLFDHGNSLFSLGGTDLWDNQKAFDEYARTLLPLAYDDFFAAAKSAIKPRHRAMLHMLLDFHFDRRATRYNLPPNRLKMIEKEVQRRARVLFRVKKKTVKRERFLSCVDGFFSCQWRGWLFLKVAKILLKDSKERQRVRCGNGYF